MDAPPGQFTALQAFNMLKEIVSGYVMIWMLMLLWDFNIWYLKELTLLPGLCFAGEPCERLAEIVGDYIQFLR